MSIQAKLISFFMRHTLKKQLNKIDKDIGKFRKTIAGSGRFSPAPADHIDIQSTAIGEFSAELLSPNVTATEQNQVRSNEKILLYFHGGGYVFGSAEAHRNLTWRLSDEANIKVLVPDYRLAPEYPFPTAIEDATAAYQWLLDNNYTANNIMLGGDSAGGGLAVALMLNLKDLDLPQPRAAILISPWVDLANSGDTMTTNARADCMLSPTSLGHMANAYLGEHSAVTPLASPLNGDLQGLPPMLIHVGSNEVLLSDAQRLKAKLEHFDVPVELEIWQGMPHVFHLLAGTIPEANRAVSQMAGFIGTQSGRASLGVNTF